MPPRAAASLHPKPIAQRETEQEEEYDAEERLSVAK